MLAAPDSLAVAVGDSLVAAEGRPGAAVDSLVVAVEDSLVAAEEAVAHKFQEAAVAAFCMKKRIGMIGKNMQGFS